MIKIRVQLTLSWLHMKKHMFWVSWIEAFQNRRSLMSSTSSQLCVHPNWSSQLHPRRPLFLKVDMVLLWFCSTTFCPHQSAIFPETNRWKHLKFDGTGSSFSGCNLGLFLDPQIPQADLCTWLWPRSYRLHLGRPWTEWHSRQLQPWMRNEKSFDRAKDLGNPRYTSPRKS